tara:strand:+ start:451 stop:1359 length:909 start_codon:yes stop_codon:yes gene_type:complete
MKICIPEDLSKDSGKHKFLSRLSRQLKTMGCEFVKNNADILLHIGRNTSNQRAKKTIMRLDGLWFNTALDFNSANKKIQKYINKSDALIYQGQFCKEAYTRFLGINKFNSCIHNGAAKGEFQQRKIENILFAHCNWRPHKRLRVIQKSFLQALDKGLDADLVVSGKVSPEEKKNHPRIKYRGWIKDKEIKELLSKAIATIHLSWLDWCPNSMIESIVAGCPVIYSDSGGSSEIGRGAGIPIKDKAWDFKPCDHYNPPSLDTNEIADAMISLKNSDYKVNREDLLIHNIARQYLEFFRKVLGK